MIPFASYWWLLAVLAAWVAFTVATARAEWRWLRRSCWSGVAEPDPEDGDPLLAEIVIHQRRSLFGWREVKREISAVPFWLRLDDGRRLRVEPGSRVSIACDLEKIERVSGYSLRAALRERIGDRRVRQGTLSRYDQLLVDGDLKQEGSGADLGPYREGGPPSPPTLHARRDRPLLLASETIRLQARLLQVMHLAYAALAAASLLLAPWWLRWVARVSHDAETDAWLTVILGMSLLPCLRSARPWYRRARFSESN